MHDGSSERRRYGRIQLDFPISGRFGETRVRVVELSLVGFLVAHERRWAPGDTASLTVDFDGEQLELTCSVIRATLWRLAKNASERTIYHSGLRIVAGAAEARARLREMIAERIVRALDEQKANARGIPPLAAYMYQPGKGDLFRRCELVNGHWRKAETNNPDQPPNGFTISAEVPTHEVDMLCRTWEVITAEGKRLTQMLAELSISKTEGVPVRRYVP